MPKKKCEYCGDLKKVQKYVSYNYIGDPASCIILLCNKCKQNEDDPKLTLLKDYNSRWNMDKHHICKEQN